MDITFLKSERFYFLLIGAAAIVLQEPETADRPWYITLGRFLALVSGAFITIGTADRLGKNIGKTETQTKEDIKDDKESK